MDTPNLQENSDTLQLPISEKQTELSARLAKLIYLIEDYDDIKDDCDDILPLNDILDTCSYLSEVETIPQAKEIMDVMVKHNILIKTKEGDRELYHPAIKEIEKLEWVLIDSFKKAVARILESKS